MHFMIIVLILAFTSTIPTQLLELEPIQRLSCTLCLPKAHPLAEKDEIHIEDLRDEPFVFITRPV